MFHGEEYAITCDKNISTLYIYELDSIFFSVKYSVVVYHFLKFYLTHPM